MRLICPNCGAQYEVPDEVIPEAGRDVQCSNCGTTWFQTREGPVEPVQAPEAPPPSPAPQPVSEPPLDEAGPATGVPETSDDHPPEVETPLGEETGRVSDHAVSDDDERGEAAAPDTDAGDTEPEPAQRRRLDPAVAGLLREEAERESRARAAETQPLESQPDLGLEDRALSRSHDSGADAEMDDGTERARTAARSRGALLPDVDEINTSLRPDHAVPEPEPEPEPPVRSSGFSRGFVLALLLGVILVALYSQAGRLAAAMPVLAPALEAYVVAIDAARVWTYETITAFLTWIEGLGGG